MPNIGYLNGQFMPLEEVRVSAEDRGYQFGDGVYEVIRTYRGRPFGLEEHLARLQRSAGEIQVSLPLSKTQWEAVIVEGIQQSGYETCKVYIQVTRGSAPRNHQFSSSLVPTVLITFREMSELDTCYQTDGIQAITVPDNRWGRCDIKSLNLLPNVLAKQQATEAGAFEAIFVRDGFITEGASSNVMMAKNETLSTPELNHCVLAGVTLKCVMGLAKDNGYAVHERAVRLQEFQDADEILLVGTTIEVLSVTQLNGRSVGCGSPGPVTSTIRRIFSESIEKTTAIPYA